MCQGESSTGVLQPIEGFGRVCRDNGALLLVDTVASLGGAPFNADQLLVDCVYTATQKVLNCPPGLSPISFGDRALYVFKISNANRVFLERKFATVGRVYRRFISTRSKLEIIGDVLRIRDGKMPPK